MTSNLRSSRNSPEFWEAALAFVQGVGALVLAWFVAGTIEAETALAYPYLWAAGLTLGGLAAASMTTPEVRNEWTWVLSGALISASMIGRGLDIAFHPEYPGYSSLAIAVWLVMGTTTAVTWVVVGAITDGLTDRG